MRTTLTLEPDVALAIRQEMRRRGKTLKTVVNERLRSGLRSGDRKSGLPPFRVKARHLGLRPGIDPDKMNQLNDELEVEAFLEKYRP